MQSFFREQYHVGEVLGEGGSAIIYKVVDKVSNMPYACKVIRLGGINSMNSLKTEFRIMQQFNHDNLLQIHEVYETPTCVWIVLPLATGTVADFIAQSKVYNELEVSKIFKQVLEGVQKLHDAGVIHRDLKIDNVLVEVSWRTMIDVLHTKTTILTY